MFKIKDMFIKGANVMADAAATVADAAANAVDAAEVGFGALLANRRRIAAAHVRAATLARVEELTRRDALARLERLERQLAKSQKDMRVRRSKYVLRRENTRHAWLKGRIRSSKKFRTFGTTSWLWKLTLNSLEEESTEPVTTPVVLGTTVPPQGRRTGTLMNTAQVWDEGLVMQPPVVRTTAFDVPSPGQRTGTSMNTAQMWDYVA
jgi:hypothetical protein